MDPITLSPDSSSQPTCLSLAWYSWQKLAKLALYYYECFFFLWLLLCSYAWQCDSLGYKLGTGMLTIGFILLFFELNTRVSFPDIEFFHLLGVISHPLFIPWLQAFWHHALRRWGKMADSRLEDFLYTTFFFFFYHFIAFSAI